MMGLVTLASVDDAAGFLRDFAMRHGICRLVLFGSVLRGEETPASDVDLLVEFEEGRTPGLLRLAQLELELEAVLGPAERRARYPPHESRPVCRSRSPWSPGPLILPTQRTATRFRGRVTTVSFPPAEGAVGDLW